MTNELENFRDLTLYLVRHGQTEDNVAGRWTGRNDSHLTDFGKRNARKCGEVLREIEPGIETIDFVASPLHRACVTMELLRDGAKLAPLAYRTDWRLMENNLGVLHQLSEDEIRQHHAEHHAGLKEDEWNWCPPRGQSQAQQHDDVGHFLQSLTRDSVIVCHGLTIRLLRAHLLKHTPSEAMSQPFHDKGVLRFVNGEETFCDV